MNSGAGSGEESPARGAVTPTRGAPADLVRGAISVLGTSSTLVALLALAVLAVRAAVRLEDRWDTF